MSIFAFSLGRDAGALAEVVGAREVAPCASERCFRFDDAGAQRLKRLMSDASPEQIFHEHTELATSILGPRSVRTTPAQFLLSLFLLRARQVDATPCRWRLIS